jgi:glycerol kinase
MTKKEIFGKEIPVFGVAGDQQAALFGQTCFDTGDIKNTYGTGCFTLMNTGIKPVVSKNRLLTTIAWRINGKTEYALEGAVFAGGAIIQWLRDNLQIIETSSESEELALKDPDTGGVYFIPAFTGLGAPYWDPDARGAILGITRGTSKSQITRAALESIAFQSYDLINAMENDSGNRIKRLKADGGATKNAFLMQFQADIIGIPVILPKIPETTALGAAYLAGLYCGYWKDKHDITENSMERKIFKPSMNKDARSVILENWITAVKTVRQFKL